MPLRIVYVTIQSVDSSTFRAPAEEVCRENGWDLDLFCANDSEIDEDPLTYHELVLKSKGEGAEGVQGLHRRIFRQPRRLAGLPRSVQRGRSGVHASPRVHEGQGCRERQGDRPLAPQDAHGRGGAAGDRPASVGRRVPSRSPPGCDPGPIPRASGPVQAHRGADDHL